ncbi:MAG: hypothetical protein CM1200mP41_05640 [Gammaproteobacteria bacterium]|nr:MAG: hypothetical protein CM1200mP41_05640 [Gammaproteobacteria bacterium]
MRIVAIQVRHHVNIAKCFFTVFVWCGGFVRSAQYAPALPDLRLRQILTVFRVSLMKACATEHTFFPNVFEGAELVICFDGPIDKRTVQMKVAN